MNPLTLNPYLAIAAGLILLGLGGWITVDTLRLKAADAEVANLKTQVQSAKSANDANVKTIDAQAASLSTWADSATKQLNEAKAAAAALAVEQAARVKTAAALKTLEAKDNALPDCTKLLAVDLAKVCPSHAQALKERSQ